MIHTSADKNILCRAFVVLPMAVLSVGLFILYSIVQMHRATVQDLCAPSGWWWRIPKGFCRGLRSTRWCGLPLLCEPVQKDVRVKDLCFLQDLHFHYFPILYNGTLFFGSLLDFIGVWFLFCFFCYPLSFLSYWWIFGGWIRLVRITYYDWISLLNFARVTCIYWVIIPRDLTVLAPFLFFKRSDQALVCEWRE